MFEFIAQIFRNMFVFVGMVTTKSSFPPALTPEEEQALLKKLAAGDDDARDKLIEHNLRLVAHIAKKYTTRGRDAEQWHACTTTPDNGGLTLLIFSPSLLLSLLSPALSC